MFTVYLIMIFYFFLVEFLIANSLLLCLTNHPAKIDGTRDFDAHSFALNNAISSLNGPEWFQLFLYTLEN